MQRRKVLFAGSVLRASVTIYSTSSLTKASEYIAAM